jgi:hypothetical protein
MPAGNIFLCGSVSVGGSAKVDITRVNISRSADMIMANADNRVFPHFGAAVNRVFTVEFETFNVTEFSASSEPGDTVSSVIVSVPRAGGSGSVSLSFPNGVFTDSSVESQHGGQPATFRATIQVVGSGGSDPTLTYSAS